MRIFVLHKVYSGFMGGWSPFYNRFTTFYTGIYFIDN